jgi:outer membrane usher protein
VRLRIVILLLAVCWFRVADAAEGESSAPSIVEITLNEQTVRTTLVVRHDANGALLLDESDLAKLRLNTPSVEPVRIDGRRYYPIDSAMGADVVTDDRTQSVHITLPPSAFVETRTALDSLSAPKVTETRPGGFINYDLYGELVGSESNVGAVLEAGAFGSFGVFTSSTLGQRAGSDTAVVRLDSTWTRDLPDRLETLRVGDSISGTGAWGRAARFGGIKFGTNFATQPTLVTTPLLSAQGEAILPSTVDVFVNGQRVASKDVAPGPFAIDGVTAINGAGQMQIVVTDALGRQQVISQPYYNGPSLLRADLNEFSLDAGAIREDYASHSNDYGDFMMAGTFRRGFTDHFTAEVHAEAESGGTGAVGADAALQLGTFGVATLTGAVGGEDGIGWLGGVGVQHNGPRLSVFAQTRFASEDFAQLGTEDLTDRPKRRALAGVGFGLGGYGNLQISYGQQTYWTRSSAAIFGLSYSATLGNFGYLNFVASHADDDDASTSAFLTWTLPLGERRTASIGVEHTPDSSGDDELKVVASEQKSVPSGTGSGYYVGLASNADAQLDYYYQGRAGLIGVEYARRDGEDGWRANASGALALTSVGVMPARTLDESFAVVELADYPDMTVYLENQPVGRTDRKGRMLLDSLHPYETNSVSVDPLELPFDASLRTTSMNITPAYRSGPVVKFPVVRASAATLRLVQVDGTPVPAGATVTTVREQASVARNGLVYLTMAAGQQRAKAEWSGHRCAFSFSRPATDGPQPDLGDVACVAGRDTPYEARPSK